MNDEHDNRQLDDAMLKKLQSDAMLKKLQSDDTRTATATKVWKVECPCGTNWVYDEFGDSLPDECENCGRRIEIMPGELAMDQYDRSDLATWLGIS